MRLAVVYCRTNNETDASETYYSPITAAIYVRRIWNSRALWTAGRTRRHAMFMIPCEGMTFWGNVDEIRTNAIVSTRARVTRAERVNAIWAITMTGQSIPDAANVLPIINSYLLACYTAIIPEDYATVESWLPDCNFSRFKLGDTVTCKKYHKDTSCSHWDAGSITILDEYYLVEICVNGKSWQRRCEYIISNDDGTHYDDVNRLLDTYMLSRAEKMIGEI